MRVPAFVAGGALPTSRRGTTLHGLISIADLFATISDVAGLGATAPPEGPAPSDSISMWKYISGVVDASPRTELVHSHALHYVDWHNVAKVQLSCPADGRARPHGVGALRRGRYKLIVGEQPFSSWYGDFSPNSSSRVGRKFEVPVAPHSCDPYCLFDIEADPAEHVDLARSRPDLAAQLLGRVRQFDASPHPPLTKPHEERGTFCEAVRAHGGFVVPWHSTPSLTPPPTPSLMPPPTPPPTPAPRLPCRTATLDARAPDAATSRIATATSRHPACVHKRLRGKACRCYVLSGSGEADCEAHYETAINSTTRLPCAFVDGACVSSAEILREICPPRLPTPRPSMPVISAPVPPPPPSQPPSPGPQRPFSPPSPPSSLYAPTALSGSVSSEPSPLLPESPHAADEGQPGDAHDDFLPGNVERRQGLVDEQHHEQHAERRVVGGWIARAAAAEQAHPRAMVLALALIVLCCVGVSAALLTRGRQGGGRTVGKPSCRRPKESRVRRGGAVGFEPIEIELEAGADAEQEAGSKEGQPQSDDGGRIT